MSAAPLGAAAAPAEAVIDTAALFTVGRWRALPLQREHVPELQTFFAANPDYFIAVHGREPGADEAAAEFDELPPAAFACGSRVLLRFVDPAGALVGAAGVLGDFIAPGVWHIGLFIVATRLHGQGVAPELHDGLVAWITRQGGRWIRLGVVAGNSRAERFWARHGYVEVRRRHDVWTGARLNTVRVLVRPLASDGLDEYLARVPRDRADSALP